MGLCVLRFGEENRFGNVLEEREYCSSKDKVLRGTFEFRRA
jgi:hypothetical protein